MAKYSYEFKLKVVQAYLNGEGSYDYLSKKNNIPTSAILKRWVATYKEFGKEGLKRSRKNNNYSFQFKLSVVDLYTQNTRITVTEGYVRNYGTEISLSTKRKFKELCKN